jgi:pyridinium-3,5-biscarboxylic acid mononucleotide synthase
VERPDLEALLAAVAEGTTSAEDAAERLADLPFVDRGHARIDLHRSVRLGLPEAIFAERKTPAQVVDIGSVLLAHNQRVLATRCTQAIADACLEAWPNAVWHDVARCITAEPADAVPLEPRGRVLIVTAGTSDMPVAEEAKVVSEAFGNATELVQDVGVAGLHRILAVRERLNAANVVIVVAGMEGALASVVGGLVAKPVIAVPTSVGYGASLGGIAALLSMLNCCAAGVTVVNIDNGFGAAWAATMINRLAPA